ncbi:MAG: RNA polymerase sigma factor [Ruminococcaceae bacterium]|nr:RNA polymerase sigma factor [Oscillospiraceae bacterium]
MKKEELLQYLDDELLDKLFGFCYTRTNDSHEAGDLCSDILLALVKSARSDGEIANVYPFIWRTARNVYADYAAGRKRHTDNCYDGDAEEIFPFIPAAEPEEDDEELLRSVYHRIAFLTKAYREVMILYYLDGLTTAEIARRQQTSEGAVRQRLFAARQKIRSEVEEMTDTKNKPVALDTINMVIWGSGNPGWGDPQGYANRLFSRHILWLCRNKAMSAAEIAEELNVPTVYVEEEMEILTKGANGHYGLLRRMGNGKYGINFVFFEKETFEKAQAVYMEHFGEIVETICRFIEEHKAEYLAYPYINRKPDWNLILWQQVMPMVWRLEGNIENILNEKFFADVEKVNRPYSVYGWEDNGKRYGGGCDGNTAHNICGFSKVDLTNIYPLRIRKHFSCNHNISADRPLQLAIRAIDGLKIDTLTENEKENAAKAIECGYLYREGDTLYTKILVSKMEDRDSLFSVTDRLNSGYFEKESLQIAEKLAALIRKNIPDYLLGEWEFANTIASLPMIDVLLETLIEKGLLVPPENGIGAEGCWMIVQK